MNCLPQADARSHLGCRGSKEERKETILLQNQNNTVQLSEGSKCRLGIRLTFHLQEAQTWRIMEQDESKGSGSGMRHEKAGSMQRQQQMATAAKGSMSMSGKRAGYL
jgi:hypothetical protein